MVKGLGVDVRKVTVIPNGVEERFASSYPELFRRTYGLGDFILYVGHIGYERKNVLTLIQALGGIDHPSVLIGPVLRNRYGEACLREAEKHRQILIIDGLNHGSDLLASAYAACDVFALPSQFETPGIAAMEASLAGAKVVITPRGGTREYFKDLVTYVDPRSVDSIREGIVNALRASPDASLKEHVLTNYTWRSIARKTSSAYKSVLGGDGPARD
jgi:glycosyltransferase involved in cell wall biosynthesis